jgi:predicted GIY-YIG superfamily endonuclease
MVNFKCPRCGEISPKHSIYIRHTKNKNMCRPVLEDVIPNENNYISIPNYIFCEYCDKSFIGEYGLNRHLETCKKKKLADEEKKKLEDENEENKQQQIHNKLDDMITMLTLMINKQQDAINSDQASTNNTRGSVSEENNDSTDLPTFSEILKSEISISMTELILLKNFHLNNVLYLIRITDKIIKFGFSSNIWERLKKHKKQISNDIQLIFCIETMYNVLLEKTLKINMKKETNLMKLVEDKLKSRIIKQEFNGNVYTELIELDSDFTLLDLMDLIMELKQTLDKNDIIKILQAQAQNKMTIQEIE